ncbi:Hypothetical protein R9X50_00380000 [Acrodontium crateriforme]|uniref:Major facilitator superfamily (MFS) profile domain-containing protein n=1 Tax=Acrodontium crateriforme TaxID=150365 RepID=A0AAQ3R4J6_9PEZI|nr:Hypothetical protein R9X50_00380000 [Acrodontium crateriforme]
MRLHSLRELDSSEGTVQLHDATGDGRLILNPTPDPNDPNDPLRWPIWKKHICFASICTLTFLTNYSIGGLAPAFYHLSLQFGKTQTETSGLLIWPILILGLFNFVWVPLGNFFGKRPVFVFASLLLCMCCLWGAVAQSFQSLLWSNIIAAVAGSSTEALGSSVVNDLYFLHQRGTMMGIYMISISGGNSIGPLVCGFVISSLSWRWHKWISFILVAINFLAIVLFCSETRYKRFKTCTPASSAVPSNENLGRSVSDVAKEVSASDQYHSKPVSVPKKTWIQQMSLRSGIGDTNLVKLFCRPLPMIVYPAVIFAFLCYAVNVAWVSAVNILSSFVLQAPPYNWKADINGLINIPGFLGNVIGSWLGGWLVDRYSNWRSKENGGIFEPESRLHLLIIPALVSSAGCLLFGYGVGKHLHWAAMFFGYGMLSVGLTFVPVVTTTYVSDSYLPVNADALLLVNGLKNVVAFGFLYGVVPWVSEAGYIDVFGTQAGIYVGIMFLAIPLIISGQRIRHKSGRWRIIL